MTRFSKTEISQNILFRIFFVHPEPTKESKTFGRKKKWDGRGPCVKVSKVWTLMKESHFVRHLPITRINIKPQDFTSRHDVTYYLVMNRVEDLKVLLKLLCRMQSVDKTELWYYYYEKQISHRVWKKKDRFSESFLSKSWVAQFRVSWHGPLQAVIRISHLSCLKVDLWKMARWKKSINSP